MPRGIQCVHCFHYLVEHTCEAYPNGIPDQIFQGLHDHTKPFKGDKGIRFKSYEQALIEEDKKFKKLQEATIKETQTRG